MSMARTVFVQNGRYVYPEMNRPDYDISFSNDNDGHRTVNLSWTDPLTGETYRERHALHPMEREEVQLAMMRQNFERETSARAQTTAVVQSMRGHPDESRHMQEIDSLLEYFDNARRFSGMSRETEQLVRVLTALHRELRSHHCAISWLINREPPRHDERFQQLELRLTSLEETIDLFNNQE